MKKIELFIAGMTLVLWFVDIFKPGPVERMFLSFGVCYVTVRFIILRCSEN